MRLLIVLSALAAAAIAEEDYEDVPVYGYRGPPAPLSKDGRVIDTSEVAQARAAHLAAHAEATARLIQSRRDRPVYNEVYEDEEPYEGAYTIPVVTHGYYGPYAQVSQDGRVVDTPEVAHAKAAHLAAHARVAANAVNLGYNAGLYASPARLVFSHVTPVGYRGPLAPIGHDGRVMDTPEVVRAKAAHLRAHAYATALTAHDEEENSY